MPLRGRLAWGYTLVFTIFFAIGFTTIYIISENYRKEVYYKRLHDKMYTTYKLLTDVKQINQELLKVMDRNTIYSLYDEKILLFDAAGNIVYNSIDDTQIAYAKAIIDRLMKGEKEIRMEDKQYELLAMKFTNSSQVAYGIAKAQDRFGKSKIIFLKNSMLIVFVIVTLMLVIVSLWLSGIIMQPVTGLAKEIAGISPQNLSVRISQSKTHDEIGILTDKFNELLDKVENAFKFQYHFIHHASHELKTPLSVMMINVEGALANGSAEAMKNSLQFQKNNLMEVSHIINAMLDISKTESHLMDVFQDKIRVDELLFECIDEISYLNNDVQLDFAFDETIESSDSLTIKGNSRMLKMAFMNLLKNAVNFSDPGINPSITMAVADHCLHIHVINNGPTIEDEDVKKLFNHLFRGSNSAGKKGFGLGLVLVQRIINIHRGTISYQITPDGRNCFVTQLPLA